MCVCMCMCMCLFCKNVSEFDKYISFTETSTDNSSNSDTFIMIGIIGGIIVVLVLILAVIINRRSNKKDDRMTSVLERIASMESVGSGRGGTGDAKSNYGLELAETDAQVDTTNLDMEDPLIMFLKTYKVLSVSLYFFLFCFFGCKQTKWEQSQLVFCVCVCLIFVFLFLILFFLFFLVVFACVLYGILKYTHKKKMEKKNNIK